MIPKRKDGYVLMSVQNERGLDFVWIGRPQTLTVRLLNATRFSIPIRRSPTVDPRIRIDFRTVEGDVTLDPAAIECNGFRVASWAGGVLELELAHVERWWFPGQSIEVTLPGVTAEGESGLGFVAIAIDDFDARVDQRQRVPLFKLDPAARHGRRGIGATWLETNRVELTRARGPKSPESALRMRLERQPSPAEVFVSFAADGPGGLRLLASPAMLARIDVTAGDAWAAARTSSDPMPVWRLTPSGGDDATVQLTGITTRPQPGAAHVVVYNTKSTDADDGYTILPLQIDAADISIDSFTVDPTSISNINTPTPVYLSWSVSNATTVLLSGAGVMNSSALRYQMMIEETTTFTLTAFDDTFSQIASQAVTVTVDPPLTQRLVPGGTIALWSGTTSNLPPLWVLCDGSNGAPDLRDRFIMGAGNTAPNTSGAADTHTHSIQELSNTFTTSTDGDHNHALPPQWQGTYFSSGIHESIATWSNYGPTQNAGSHSHSVAVTFGSFTSGANNGGVLPPWYALCYIMKVSS